MEKASTKFKNLFTAFFRVCDGSGPSTAQWKQIEDKPELSSPDMESQSMGLVNPSIKCTRAVGSRDSPEGSVPYPRPVREPVIRAWG